MKLFELLETQLKTENNFVTDEGELKKWVVLDKARNFDARLLEILLDNEELKTKFFVDVKGTLIFNLNLFIEFLEQKNYLNDSYTQYKNKVGLTIDGKYLKQRNEVALVWPFKDCILEGGQSREEDKREEIFFNETLAQDEITQLLEPKVLTNAKTYDKDGERAFSGFTRNAELNKQRGLPDNTITDNLIIKGNNLLALHSLKKEFAGKVKLIYIDPPYNTGNDGFNYNDRFNHSSWLTFMKNRLEIAKNLLKEDGSIYIQLDYNQVHYFKVLMDEIFGIENFQREIIWDISVLSGYKTIANNWIRGHDSILFYSKNNSSLDFKKVKTNHSEKYLSRFNKVEESSGRKFFDGRGEKLYLDDVIKKGKAIGDVWNDIISFQQAATAKERIKDFSGQKPENLIERIMLSATNENEIILDFHLGSGTTAATAHKMSRQYIGVEQMNYLESIAVERLVKVIEGDQGGISKSVNWQGGGSFTYFELKKYNQIFIEQIEEAENTETLLKIWEQMKAHSFLNYNVDIQKQDAHIEDFKTISVEEQKQHLVEILDKNQLYVNISSIYDTDFACTQEEKQVTNGFYQLNR